MSIILTPDGVNVEVAVAGSILIYKSVLKPRTQMCETYLMSKHDPLAAENPTETALPTLTVDFWADFVCPWCYLGERRFFLALSQFEHADRVTVRRHPFELDSNSETCGSERMVDVIEKKYGIDSEKAHALEARLSQLCSEVNLEYSVDRVPANTLDAHRLIALAQESDETASSALAERLYRAHFVEHACIGDRDTLKSLAGKAAAGDEARDAIESGNYRQAGETTNTGEAVLSAGQIDALYGNDRYTNEVRMDSHRALELGAEGVPFFVFDSRLALAGAQASEVFLEALNKAWQEMSSQEG